MLALRRTIAAISAAAMTTVALSACGLGSSEYCDALSDDTNKGG